MSQRRGMMLLKSVFALSLFGGLIVFAGVGVQLLSSLQEEIAKQAAHIKLVEGKFAGRVDILASDIADHRMAIRTLTHKVTKTELHQAEMKRDIKALADKVTKSLEAVENRLNAMDLASQTDRDDIYKINEKMKKLAAEVSKTMQAVRAHIIKMQNGIAKNEEAMNRYDKEIVKVAKILQDTIGRADKIEKKLGPLCITELVAGGALRMRACPGS